MWTVLSWTFIPFLALKFGVLGASIGYALVGSSSLIAIYIAKKYVNFSISDSIVKPLLGSLIMGGVLILIKRFLDISINSMLILGLIGVLVYGSSMVSMMGISLIEDAKKALKLFSIVSLILIGSIIWSLTMVRSGINYDFGLGFGVLMDMMAFGIWH